MPHSDSLEPSGIKINSVFEAASPVELFFTPEITSDVDFTNLGLLGEMVSTPCLLEYFRIPATSTDVCNSLLQLFNWHKKLDRHAESEGEEALTEDELPYLWIISSSISDELLAEFDARPASDWGPGLYFLDDEINTGIVAIDQLPVTDDTLFLRMLGRGTVLQQAITEFIVLPKAHPSRKKVIKIAGNWCAETLKEEEEELTEEDKELLKLLFPIYQQWLEEEVELD
ncbi:MAG: hypothetical protein VSS75_031490 [Candidatus Parabeggiatoa sp.]|nr:hypothetical protein [Candidatus Parabeggiatoa sp.]